MTTKMAPTSTARASFPSDLYVKYKQATSFFQRWLIRARKAGVGASTTLAEVSGSQSPQDIALQIYHDIVGAIAREPTALPPSLLKLWPQALAACETAITLRARVALFFPPSTKKGGDSHAHFLGRLRSWLKTLQDAGNNNAEAKPREKRDFSNYYAVLELPDDYFPVEDDFEQSPGPAQASIQSQSAAVPAPATPHAELFDDAFDDDLNVELSFLFMELEELSEAVYDAFLEVKREKKTLVEATAVAKVAVDCASTVIARLQLRYPSIATGQDMIALIQERAPPEQLQKLLDKVKKAWTPVATSTPRSPRRKYVAGTIIADLLWVSRGLESFVPVMPVVAQRKIFYREDVAGELYDEDRTPHYCMPDMNAHPSFFAQQLPLLYNVWLVNHLSGIQHTSTTTLVGWFLSQTTQFFTTRRVSIPFVFLAICWIRSVAALQGNGGLRRHISVTLMQRWNLVEFLHSSAINGAVEPSDTELIDMVTRTSKHIQMADNVVVLVRANPLLAGCTLLDHQFRYLDLACEAVLTTSHVRAFGHLYHALRDRKLLDANPFFEDVLQVYERFVFTPSRAASVHGSFTRSYLVSSNMTDAAVDAMLGRRPPPPEKYTKRVREHYHLEDLSCVYRLLQEKDFSVLPAESRTTASWKTLLHSVSELSKSELFQSRVLSRDMFTLCGDIRTIFRRLCSALGRRHVLAELIATRQRTSRENLDDRAVEEVVVIPLLPFLDCLNHDGSISVSEDTADLVQREGSQRALAAMGANGTIEAYCRRAATVVSEFFRQYGEEDYFTLPLSPRWVTLEFGGYALPRTDDISDKAIDTIGDLMAMMVASNGPLDDAKRTKLEDFIIEEPSVLLIGGFGVPVELCTLLHQAAAGPAADLRLVEWLIQMDALHYQPKHLRNPRAPGLLKAAGLDERFACNTLAVHNAAKAGYFNVVRLILEAEHLRDINTVTYHTRESLAHLVVKHGHRELFDWLLEMGVDVRQPDSLGTHVHELTNDVAWKRAILVAATHQHREEANQRGFKNQEAKRHEEFLAAAEKQRQALQNERKAGGEVTVMKPSTSGPAASTAVADQPFSVGTSTKTNKKKKTKKKKAPPAAEEEATGVAAATTFMESLAISSSPGVADPGTAVDRIDKLSGALDILLKGSAVPESEREASAALALTIVEKLQDTTQRLATRNLGREITPGSTERLALEASRCLFLLSKYLRQLPEPPKRLHRSLVKTPEEDSRKLSPLEKLHQCAGAPSHFLSFLSFAIRTAHILASCTRTAQAAELLELIERRLLKMKSRPPNFRSLVVLFVGARRDLGLKPAVGSSSEAQRAFEWYASCPQGIENDALLQLLDALHGHACYLRLKCVEEFDSYAFSRFLDLVEGIGGPRHEELQGMVFVDNYVVAGAESREKLTHKFKLIMEIAQISRLHFYADRMHVGEEKMPLVGYMFSATEIVRAT